MLHIGDSREVLRSLPDQSVHCCVTSPPYFGLRDYGVDGQIGLEPTPDEFVAEMVAVFREVRRVLRDDGTLWLNLGDSYANDGKWGGSSGGKHVSALHGKSGIGRGKVTTGLKPKDLIGIPWRVAFALQQPYYTGAVADERDRVWLAAMLDAEGCITASEYTTGDRLKSNIYIGITNASVPVIEKCGRVFPQAKENVYQKGGVVNRTVFRWDVERMDQKALFLREIYPYLVAKRKQAIVGYTFIEMQRGLPSKKKGYLPEQQEKRSWLVKALSTLNKGGDVDLPDWAIEPPSLFEPGFYLRQDVIWHKPNPMPESVKDRCTKAHEYIFMMSKSSDYFYDHEAVKEAAVRPDKGAWVDKGSDKQRGHGRRHAGFNGRYAEKIASEGVPETRNRRSVWTVPPKPFKGAHFATFPPDLIEPCILAGCPQGGTVLDPFFGAGTTGLVAQRTGRRWVGIELNPEYGRIALDRLGMLPSDPWDAWLTAA